MLCLQNLIYSFQELEELKNSNKAVMHEKLVAVARAKELMRQEHLSELDRIKEQLKQVQIVKNEFVIVQDWLV
jgi:predicted RND superfamily exporter protein